MKKFLTFKYLLVAVLGFFSLAANAQYSHTIERYQNTDYSTKAATFKLSDVAQTLGTDTATLVKALETWRAQPDSIDSRLFGIPSFFKVSDVNCDSTTNIADVNAVINVMCGGAGLADVNCDATVNIADVNAVINVMCGGTSLTAVDNAYYGASLCDGPGSYWLNQDGTAGEWGKGAIYNDVDWDATKDEFYIAIGNHPDNDTIYTANANFILNFGGKQATFAITYNTIAVPDAPEVPEFASKLNIVGNAEFSSSQKPNSTYATKSVSVNIPDLAEKLGIDESLMAGTIANMIYATQYNTEYGIDTDTLQALPSYSDGWVGKTVTEAGEASNICAAHIYGDGCIMFLQGWAYDEETKDFSFNVGQFPGALAAGDTAIANVYVCYGDKAYKVEYTLYGEKSTFDPDITKKKQVGYVDLTYNMDAMTSYDTTSEAIDGDAIAAALGCEKSALALYALSDATTLTDDMTQDGVGYWIGTDGFKTTWGNGGMIYVNADDDFSAINLGQYPGKLAAGDTLKTSLYFVNADNDTYYAVNITLAIKKAVTYDQTTWTVEGKKSCTINMDVDATYAWSDESFDISADDLVSTIGCSAADAVLYAPNYDSLVVDNTTLYTKTYTCDPHPAFWCSADGHAETWGNNTFWGVKFVAGDDGKYTLSCIQFPGLTADGDQYTGTYYLVNEENGKMMQVNVTFNIGTVADPVEEVANINIKLPVSESDSSVDFDTEAVATALGLGDDLLTGYYLRGKDANNKYGNAVAAADGLTFNTSGAQVDMESIGVYFEDGKIITYSTGVEDDWKADAVICFEANNKRYVINISFMSQKLYDEQLNQ